MRRAVLITVCLLAGIGGAALARDVLYREKPLPGAALREVALARPVSVMVGGKSYEVRPGEALMPDDAATRAALVRAGRGSFLGRVRRLADPSPPALLVDPVLVARPGVDELAGRLSRALPRPRRAQVLSRGGTFTVIPSRPGDAVDADRLPVALEKVARGGATTLTPPLTHVEPELTSAAAEEAVAEAKELIAEPIALSFKGAEVGSLAPRRLARLVRSGRTATVSGSASRPTGSRRSSSRRVAAAEADPRRPDDARGAETGDPRADLHFTTEMGPSSANRIHNVQLMAEYIDGTIIPPGERFSFNESVGPRTAERGFREGQMMIGSLLVASIGGGLCQTATTLFNNAFELGLPILARQNHSFYISHYPLGRDAAVSWAVPTSRSRTT